MALQGTPGISRALAASVSLPRVCDEGRDAVIRDGVLLRWMFLPDFKLRAGSPVGRLITPEAHPLLLQFGREPGSFPFPAPTPRSDPIEKEFIRVSRWKPKYSHYSCTEEDRYKGLCKWDYLSEFPQTGGAGGDEWEQAP